MTTCATPRVRSTCIIIEQKLYEHARANQHGVLGLLLPLSGGGEGRTVVRLAMEGSAGLHRDRLPPREVAAGPVRAIRRPEGRPSPAETNLDKAASAPSLAHTRDACPGGATVPAAEYWREANGESQP